MNNSEVADIFVIGGGVNGCGIARDAAGRGLSVILAEQGDLAQGTSSASSKLFHGGLRYLERFEFRLVREALRERESLLQAMPHIAWPLRFVLPYRRGLRSRLMLRAGLLVYDNIGGRRLLPASRAIDLRSHRAGAPLRSEYTHGFEYSDCWIDDARLVVLNARDAAARGATILTGHEVIAAAAKGTAWHITTRHAGSCRTYRARNLINAAGPWAGRVLAEVLTPPQQAPIRLVRGSHIVVDGLFTHGYPYILQGRDKRIVFAIPYLNRYTLIGTTDVEQASMDAPAICSTDEIAYLCQFASEYFRAPITPAAVKWHFAGVRPLYDEGTGSASNATRDYVLSMARDASTSLRLLNVFGGKITTYRTLAQAALAKLGFGGEWTAGVPLPGGDFPWRRVSQLQFDLAASYPFLNNEWAWLLIRRYGTEAFALLGDAKRAEDMGQSFGAYLTAREALWLRSNEFATTAEDILWRRTKAGLDMTSAQRDAFAEWIQRTVN